MSKRAYSRTGIGRHLAIAMLLTGLLGCSPNGHEASSSAKESTSGLSAKPNILWLVVEDMSPVIPDFGDNTITTPTISGLAAEGVKYTNVFSPSGVCAPSRAALALGMYPSAIGANHMRTTSHTDQTGLPRYEAVPPAEARMLSQYLRAHGYYTTNNLKTDYQFRAPKTAWDENGPTAHWRNRSEGKPFFAVFNFTTTHESGLFEPYGFREIESRHYFAGDAARIEKLPKDHSVKSTESDTVVHVPKDMRFDIPPYLPDTDIVRRDVWKMYNNIAETDRQIGAVLQQLKNDGLYDETIIFFYSDHGGPLPRQKRLIYDSGLRVPLIIRFPNGSRAGTADDRLVSFVDFAPATMKLAGISTPRHMHGRDFIQADSQARQYIHAAADRFDGFTDAIRAVRDKRFKYIRNYRPEQPYYLPVTYRERIPAMQELLRLREEGQLNEFQMQWFRATKPKEELFDTQSDPHELHNLASNPEYADRLDRLRRETDRWLADIGDTPNLPERDLIGQLWSGSTTQPQTAAPQVSFADGLATMTSATRGASIAYRIMGEPTERTAWQLYQRPVAVPEGTRLEVVAHRMGYRESPVQTYAAEHGAIQELAVVSN